MGDLGDHLRIQTASAAIMAFADIPHAGSRMARAHAFTAPAGHAAAVAKFNGGNRLIDRPSGGDLHDKKVNRDDGPQGGDDQQQTAEKIRTHDDSLSPLSGKSGGFVDVIPPGIKAEGIDRAHGRHGELVPAREAVFAHVPHRQHVVIPG